MQLAGISFCWTGHINLRGRPVGDVLQNVFTFSQVSLPLQDKTIRLSLTYPYIKSHTIMSDTDDTDVTQRAPFDPATVDPEALAMVKFTIPKIYGVVPRKTNPRDKPQDLVRAAREVGTQPAYPCDPNNLRLHTYRRKEYKALQISTEEQYLANKIMHQARVLHTAYGGTWPANQHVAIFIDDSDPENLSMAATLSSVAIHKDEDQVEMLDTVASTEYVKTTDCAAVMRMLSIKLTQDLDQVPAVPKASTPVRELERVMHDILPPPPKRNPRVGDKLHAALISDPNVSIAIRDGLYAEIANLVGIRNSTQRASDRLKGELYVTVLKGESQSGQAHMRALLLERAQVSNAELSEIMREQMELSTMTAEDVDAMTLVQQTDWL